MRDDWQALIDTISKNLMADDRVEALWLAGSLARGDGDAFSDVDFVALCAPRTIGAVGTSLAAGPLWLPPPLLVTSLFGGRVISVVGPEWQRYDFSLIEAAQLFMHDPKWLSPLFNKTGATPTGTYPASYIASAQSLLPIIKEFLRLLGLAVVVAGREEYVVLMSGVDQLRSKLIDLMLEENGIGPLARGGHLSRKSLLTAAQYEELESLPPLCADRESTLANHVALARIFIPRAKRLCTAVNADWPTKLEAATRLVVEQGLGILV